jgi:hypothetical protein
VTPTIVAEAAPATAPTAAPVTPEAKPRPRRNRRGAADDQAAPAEAAAPVAPAAEAAESLADVAVPPMPEPTPSDVAAPAADSAAAGDAATDVATADSDTDTDAEAASASTPAPAAEPGALDRPPRSRRPRRGGRRGDRAGASNDAAGERTDTADHATADTPATAAPAADASHEAGAAQPAAAATSPAPAEHVEPVVHAPPAAPRRPAVARSAHAHSAIALSGGDLQTLQWQPGQQCPGALSDAAERRLDDTGHLRADDDDALPTLLRLAHEAGHRLDVAPAVWPLLAASRDARTRAHRLALHYPDGPASAALQTLLRAPLPLFQAEAALFAVVAGRALLADERGLGKTVQAIAAATLWQRHFGVQRVLVLCAPAQAVAWQRSWQRFAGVPAQLMAGGLHQRQALWSTDAAVRIITPDALASDAAHVAHWALGLVIVDEPQQLGEPAASWAALDAPHALVLCGAPLYEQPALLDALITWLDPHRQGPLAAVRRIQAAQAQGEVLDDDAIEQITDQLARALLQRQHEDVADQLPPLVHSERLLPLAPPQRAAHDAQLALVRRLIAGWQHTGYLSDSDQYRLGQALRDAQDACHRADPAVADSPLADATVQAIAGQLADWAGTGAPRVAVLCATPAQQAQLRERLADALSAHHDSGDGQALPTVQLVLAGEPVPAGTQAVLQLGVPWRTRRGNGGRRSEAPRGQQWLYLVGQDSLEAGLFDTLAQRTDVPRSLADGGRAYLQGDALADWLKAIAAALAALQPDPAGVPSVTHSG